MPSEHRLHPASILFALSGSLKTFALPALVVIVSSLLGTDRAAEREREAGSPFDRFPPAITEMEGWQVWLLVFLALAVVNAVLRYLTFRITYEGTELVIRSGLLFRNDLHLPYYRIQNLDATRGVVHRALGVADVRVETGGGQEPEARISVLREAEFEEMRRRVFAGRTPSPASTRVADAAAAVPEQHRPREAGLDAAPAPVEAAHTLLHLPLRELLLLGVLDNRGFLFLLAAYGLVWESGLQGLLWERLTAELSAPGLVSAMWRGVGEGRIPSATIVAVMFAGLIGFFVLVRLLSMLWVSVTLYGFRLSRVGADLRTEYGLLTRVTTTIPLRRIQSVTIRETTLQRWCGRASVRVQTAGGQGGAAAGAKRSRELLAPLVRAELAPGLVQDVMAQADLASVAWQPLHPRAARRAVKPLLVMIVVSTAGGLAIAGLQHWPAVAVCAAAGLLAAMPITRRQVQATAWASDETTVAVRRGWLWRSVTIAPVSRIQCVTVTESPFDRRTGMAVVHTDTAGGSDASYRLRIPFLARGTATTLAAMLSKAAARTTFRW